LSTTDMGRRRIYSECRALLRQLQVATAKGRFTITDADTMISEIDEEWTINWPEAKEEKGQMEFSHLCTKFRHRKLNVPESNPEFSTFAKGSIKKIIQDSGTPDPDVLFEHLRALEFHNLDTRQFLALRIWMALECTTERISIQTSIFYMALLFVVGAFQMGHSVFVMHTLTVGMFSGLWLLIGSTIVLVLMFNSAVVFNRALSDGTAEMLDKWRDRAMGAWVKSTCMERSFEDLRKGEASVFLSNARVQVDSYILGVTTKLAYIKELVRDRELPVSFLGMEITASFRNRLFFIVISATATFASTRVKTHLDFIQGQAQNFSAKVNFSTMHPVGT